jgi:CSLREA domain-containing protein
MSPFPPFQVRLRALCVVSVCLFLLAMALMWTRLQHAATTIVVNSTSDATNASDGLCTLREAISAANNNVASGAAAGECAAGSSSGADVIDATGVTGTINLTGALPSISSSMTITGPGSSQLTVRRNTGGDYRIFTITSTVTISGLTATNGKAGDGTTASGGGPGADGGGIMNSGTLTLADVAVTGNVAGTGGTGTTSNGGSGGQGGGIFSTGPLTMTNCSVTNNTAGRGGNGINLVGHGKRNGL